VGQAITESIEDITDAPPNKKMLRLIDHKFRRE
jgi:hypothetical protein